MAGASAATAARMSSSTAAPPYPEVAHRDRSAEALERDTEGSPTTSGLLTFGGAVYPGETAELAGFDVAIVGAPMDDLVSDRPGARMAPRAIRGASFTPSPAPGGRASMPSRRCGSSTTATRR